MKVSECDPVASWFWGTYACEPTWKWLGYGGVFFRLTLCSFVVYLVCLMCSRESCEPEMV